MANIHYTNSRKGSFFLFYCITLMMLSQQIFAQQRTDDIEITEHEIIIHKNILFEAGQQTIKSESKNFLKKIAEKLIENPHLTEIEIQGHTDSSGQAESNLRLSQKRAESVMFFLITEGVQAKRLSAKGFGDSQPISDNASIMGREKNRRVNFLVKTIDNAPNTDNFILAKISAKYKKVDSRQPKTKIWSNAYIGQELDTSWRVQSRKSASAEITFFDQSQIFMREKTLVIIYGSKDNSNQRRLTQSAFLEKGSLRNRLAELAGTELTVETPSSEAVLSSGNSVIAVDQKGKSQIAIHKGKTAKVYGRKKGKRNKKSVAVKAGYGTIVEKGKDPLPPRKLPEAPTWKKDAQQLFLNFEDHPSTVKVYFTPIKTAKKYLIQISKKQDAQHKPQTLLAIEVKADLDSFEIKTLETGNYFAQISSIDTDGLESVPSEAFNFSIRTLKHQPSPKRQKLTKSTLLDSRLVAKLSTKDLIFEGDLLLPQIIKTSTEFSKEKLTCDRGKAGRDQQKLLCFLEQQGQAPIQGQLQFSSETLPKEKVKSIVKIKVKKKKISDQWGHIPASIAGLSAISTATFTTLSAYFFMQNTEFENLYRAGGASKEQIRAHLDRQILIRAATIGAGLSLISTVVATTVAANIYMNGVHQQE